MVGDIPKPPTRREGVRILTASALLFGVEVEMESNLVLEIAIISSLAQQNAKAVTPAVEA